MDPTTEQRTALDLFGTGQSLAIEAGAGTGKTSTLVMLGESTTARGQYIALNKSIVTDATHRLPSNVAANTAHSLAFRTVGHQFKHRLNSSRMRSDQIAAQLGLINPIAIRDENGATKMLRPAFLGSLVMQAIGRFCNSADDRPGSEHVPYIEGIDQPVLGRRTYANNNLVASTISSVLPRAWADLSNPNGSLRFTHDCYLKMYQLRLSTGELPGLPVDFIAFDECQDASPVLISIVDACRDAQRIFVGDSNQQLYEWRGAVNSFAHFKVENTTMLTQSFRFGPAIADVANSILSHVDTQMRLAGMDAMKSTVEAVDNPSAVLTRSNSAAVEQVFKERDRGRVPHLIGGGSEVSRFAKGALDLQTKGSTTHPELACFSSWDEVRTYVYDDPSGSELALLVKLVQDYGAPEIIGALEKMPTDENRADVVISTVHKAKGREWESVQLGHDFPAPKNGAKPSQAELRLLYVAATRAKMTLDITRCESLNALLGDKLTGDVVEDSTDSVRVTLTAEPPVIPALNGAITVKPQVSATKTVQILIPKITRESHISSEESQWWIGRCVTHCRHAVKLYGHKSFDGAQFLGFFEEDGTRFYLPECPEHHRRPFMKAMVIKPPKPGAKCNSRCWNAISEHCDCPCQGSNHGTGHAPQVALSENTA